MKNNSTPLRVGEQSFCFLPQLKSLFTRRQVTVLTLALRVYSYSTPTSRHLLLLLRFSQRNTETWTNFRCNESENRHGSRKLQSAKNWRISSDLIFYLRTKTDCLKKKNRYNTLNESSSRLREHNEQARKNKRKEEELLRIISSDWPLRKLRLENTRTCVMSHGLAWKWGLYLAWKRDKFVIENGRNALSIFIIPT